MRLGSVTALLLAIAAISGCGLPTGGQASWFPKSFTDSSIDLFALEKRSDQGDSRSIERRVVAGIDVDAFTSAPMQKLKQVRLHAPVSEVFQYVGNHEAMTEWIPLMHRVTMDHRDSENGSHSCGVGSERVCKIGPDEIRERIVVWKPNQCFAYRVEDDQKGVPLESGFGLLTFEPVGNTGTIMTWRIYYQPKKWHPKAVVMPAMVNMQLNGGLKNLVKKFGGAILVK